MNKEEQMIETWKYEVQKLEENPFYQDWVKVKKVMQDGQAIEGIIQKKLNMIRMTIAKMKQQPQPEEEYEEELEEPIKQRPMPRKIVPKMKREEYQEPNDERVREIEEKIAKAEKRGFEVDKEELGLTDDIPGLPEDE